MPNLTQSSDFWGWYLRHNNRVVWRELSDAGIDVFAVGPSNNTQAFLDLTNVLPALNGGFAPRWPLTYATLATESTAPLNAPIVRNFIYNYPQDAADPSNTANTSVVFSTDGQYWNAFTDAWSTFSGYGPTAFSSGSGTPGGITSRGWFYYGNGVDAPRKVNPSYTAASTDSLIGIANLGAAASATGSFVGEPSLSAHAGGTGFGYLTPPAATITDPTGSGSGATATTSIDALGRVIQITITNRGSGYKQANIAIAAPPMGGTQATAVLYVQLNSSAPMAGEVVGVDLGGQMQFISGRQYLVALQDSLTGHTSDVYLGSPSGNIGTSPRSGIVFNQLTTSYNTEPVVDPSVLPVYIASTGGFNGVTAGFTSLGVEIFVPATGLDSTVDTVLLLATSDGGSIGTLYEVASIPFSDFTYLSGYTGWVYNYIDTIPDSYNDQNILGTTLLASNLWAYTDPSGDTFGILLNEPPSAAGFLYPTLHQGRMFATDGKTIFFSKSLDEVTTSTGVITSKWEECWPGDYQLPVALNNETILGLISDGTNLHIGTDKSIFTMYGSDPSNFDIPNQAFAQTGILSNDLWTVIYSEGIPSGFLWVTQDFKVVHSDFSTYREVGTPIYPYLLNWDTTKTSISKINSLTQGPYNFVFLEVFLTTQVAPIFFVWETRLQKWYKWTLPTAQSGTGWTTSSSFVYQYPSYTGSSFTAGSKFLFFHNLRNSGGSNNYSLNYFDPTSTTQGWDYDATFTPWNIQTSWQDFGDPTAIKVINEIELTSDIPPLTVTLWGATSQAQFESGGVQLKTGPSVTGPMSALATNKFYCAGVPTGAKYYSIQIGRSSLSGMPYNIKNFLSSFSAECYPMARI